MYRIQNRMATVSIAVALSLALVGGSFAAFTPQVHAASNEEIKTLITTLLAQITTLQAKLEQMRSNEGGFTNQLAIGDEVVTTGTLKVRREAVIAENVLSILPASARGTIVEGPKTSGGYIWWKISYTNGVAGWSAENWLKTVGSEKDPVGDVVKVKAEIDSVTTSENPYIKGTASGVSDVRVSISGTSGDKVHGSSLIPVVDGRWTHKVNTDLVDGKYTLLLYIIQADVRKEMDRQDFIVANDTAPSCDVETDKKIYTPGDDLKVSWSTKNAKYVKASFRYNTLGQEVSVGMLQDDSGDKTSGSTVIEASVPGAAYLVLTAVADNGSSSECLTQITIDELDTKENAKFKATVNGAIVSSGDSLSKDEANDACVEVYVDAQYSFDNGDILKCYWDGEQFNIFEQKG